MFQVYNKTQNTIPTKWQYFSCQLGRCKQNSGDSAVVFVRAAHVDFACTARKIQPYKPQTIGTKMKAEHGVSMQ
jgi:hypothetical protein